VRGAPLKARGRRQCPRPVSADDHDHHHDVDDDRFL
jgi:hypothetical protein